jgi:sugar-specific transcriptional regulator TrmB
MANDNSETVDLLKQLGLSDYEAQTYQALLKLDAVSIRKVAEQSGINRGTTYEAIKKLLAHGLVSARQNGKREYYSAESPEKIYDIIRERRKELWQTLQDAQKLVPTMRAQSVRPEGRPLVRYFEDDEGIVSILKDVLRTCSQLEKAKYYAYSSRPLRQYLYRKFPQFTERRIREGISVQVIAIGKGGGPAPSSERKWLTGHVKDDVANYVIIYGDKVASISISNDFVPYGVVTEDAGAAAMQRLLFEQLWERI